VSLTRKTQALVAAVVLVGSGSVAFARMQLGEERSIPYQGVLEQNGVASTGPVTLRFSLFDAAVGGALVWKDEHVVDVVNGRFAVVLGDGDGDVLDDAVLETPALFLEIDVLGDGGLTTTLSPRQEIIPVPLAARAVHAVKAASVADKSITRASLADDVRFAATFTHSAAGGFVVAGQTPAGWADRSVFARDTGDVILIEVPAGLICVSSSVVAGVVASIENVQFFNIPALRVITQNRAGAGVNTGFSIICELP